MEFKDRDKFPDFEAYWRANKGRLLLDAPQQLKTERTDSGKLNTPGDWLLAPLPIVAMILFMRMGWIASELLNLVGAIAVGVVLYVLGEMAKPYVTGKRSVADIDRDIQEYFRREWEAGEAS